MSRKEQYRLEIENLLQEARDLKSTMVIPEDCIYYSFLIQEKIAFTDEYESEDIEQINDIIWSYFEYYEEYYGYYYTPEQMEEDWAEIYETDY